MTNHDRESRGVRRLSNGKEIIWENIDEQDDEIIFEFEFTDPLPSLEEVSEIYTPNSGNDIIFQKLVEKGWILPDGTTLEHFKMDVLENKENNRLKLRYYLHNSEQTKMVH